MTDARTSEGDAQLDYAPAPRLTRRKTFRRAMLAAGILVIVVSGWVMLPRYWHNWRETIEQRQWMRYTRPPTLVAFEPPGAKAKALFKRGTGYIMRPGGVFHQLGVTGFRSDALFLHARRRPDGQQRIVWATLGYERTLSGIQLRLEGDVLIPATPLRASLRTGNSAGPLIADAAGHVPRIYAGQSDPADESHFTMKYEFTDDGRCGTIHGRLTDNDTVDFEVEPATGAKKEAK